MASFLALSAAPRLLYKQIVTIVTLSEDICLFLKCTRERNYYSLYVLIYISLTVKASTFIFISGRGSAISPAKEGKSGFIYNLVRVN